MVDAESEVIPAAKVSAPVLEVEPAPKIEPVPEPATAPEIVVDRALEGKKDHFIVGRHRQQRA